MTGFGTAEGPVAGGQLRVEIRSVNHRYFSLSAKLPGALSAVEGDLRERLRKDFERGHLNVFARWTSVARSAGTVELNLPRAREAMARLRELQTAVGLSGEIPLDLVARQPEVFTSLDDDGVAVSWREVEPIVAEAARQCRAMRGREGAILADELTRRLGQLGDLTKMVEGRVPERLLVERDRLRAAVALLLDGRAVDEHRLMQELAFLAEKLDVTEELVRLGSHLDAARTTLAGDQAVGKQLGFLAQEIGREINTIGSKANDAEILHAVIAMKGELEKFREQLENLE